MHEIIKKGTGDADRLVRRVSKQLPGNLRVLCIENAAETTDIKPGERGKGTCATKFDVSLCLA
jgi:hypothetical protein